MPPRLTFGASENPAPHHTPARPSTRWLAGLLALVLAIVACVPAPEVDRQPLPPPQLRAPGGPGFGSTPVRSLLSLPPTPFEAHHDDAGGVVYRARGGGLTAHYGPTGVSYALAGYDPAQVDAAEVARCTARPADFDDPCDDLPPLRRWWATQELLGARIAPPEAAEPADTVVSYLVGQELVRPSDDWRPDLPTYHRLVYRDLWPGIDLAYERADARRFKSTYFLGPGADPDHIRLLWRGAQARIAEDGSLVLSTPLGELRESAPRAWQETDGRRVPVAVRFAILSHLDHQDAADPAGAEIEVGFALGPYNPSEPLVIDPYLQYAGYIGGNLIEAATAVAVHTDGTVYAVGATDSTATSFPTGGGFLTTPGFDQSRNDGCCFDAYVVRVNPAGTGLVYATYLGGSAPDIAHAVAVGADGSAFVVGQTGSSQATFPDGDPNGNDQMDVPGFDQTFNSTIIGLDDAFAVKLNPSGTGLVYATYIGGASDDRAFAVALDAAGNATVGGLTASDQATFPDGDPNNNDRMDVPGFDQTFNGRNDAFVVRLSASGLQLLYATYLGGEDGDLLTGVAVDGAGAATVAGFTDSTQMTFPTGGGFLGTPGLDQTHNGGGSDGFVVKLSPAGTGLVYATYVGGAGSDSLKDLALDADGSVYVVGDTRSTEQTFPDGDANGNGRMDVPGFDQTHNGERDVYVVKLNASGTAFLYATYVGGSADEDGNGIAVDGHGSAYLVGATDSNQKTFPDGDPNNNDQMEAPGFDQTANGGSDAFLVKLDPSGSRLEHATFLGGTGADDANAVAVDRSGNAYVLGQTASSEQSFPDGDPNNNDEIDAPSFDRTLNGSQDAYALKLADPTPTPTPVPCVSRPNVLVQTQAAEPGRLLARLAAQTGPGVPVNGLQQIQFTVPANAVVDVGGVTGRTGSFAVPLAGQPPVATFTVRRTGPGAVTVRLVVIDGCGPWQTFLGGGPNAF